MPEEPIANNESQEGPEGIEGGSKKATIIIVVIIVVLAIALGAYALLRRGDSEGSEQITPESASVQKEEPISPPVASDTTVATTTVATSDAVNGVIVTFEPGLGYTPKSVTIAKGESVTFKNNSGIKFWPASAMHPTHQVYPGSDIAKCGTSEEPKLFDSCRGLDTGATWTFKFDEIGTWNYHDHLSPEFFGKVVVE
ncbi:MAG: hypothetical protein Q8L21_01785 [Candidatus Komeilibacteria bacterium]|nr:hypothetical protein [Candidatus Komeilibacteria bacterium]